MAPGSFPGRPPTAVFVSAAGTEQYVDPDSGNLRNYVGARTQVEYDTRKADLVGVRAVQILAGLGSSPGWEQSGHTFFARMREHHQTLHQDVFPFAGQFRQAEMRFPDGIDTDTYGPGAGGVRYMSCADIEQFLDFVDEFLQGHGWPRSYVGGKAGVEMRSTTASRLQAITGFCRPFVDGNEDAFWMTIYELYRDADAGFNTRRVKQERHATAWVQALRGGSLGIGPVGLPCDTTRMQKNFRRMDLRRRHDPDLTSKSVVMKEARRLNVGTVPEKWPGDGPPGPAPRGPAGGPSGPRWPDSSSGPLGGAEPWAGPEGGGPAGGSYAPIQIPREPGRGSGEASSGRAVSSARAGRGRTGRTGSRGPAQRGGARQGRADAQR